MYLDLVLVIVVSDFRVICVPDFRFVSALSSG